MWLTRVLMAQRSTPGRMFAGKNRLVRKITATQRRNTVIRERRMENVERLLSTPFLSPEEEHGHTSNQRREERRQFIEKKQKAKSLGPHVYAAGKGTLSKKSQAILDHLNVSKVHHIDLNRINKVL
ncbi:ribosomal protein 63, mitochondrial [Nematostella vectensis]|uniref:ribosomal protein 63, mitochondrial n=1 Tax=Nematostella vectensis TaxID=45351 RepID=UPI00207705CF|nr:ribosomal protein 63, mitochondrial [Nematostella vectensis]